MDTFKIIQINYYLYLLFYLGKFLSWINFYIIQLCYYLHKILNLFKIKQVVFNLFKEVIYLYLLTKYWHLEKRQ